VNTKRAFLVLCRPIVLRMKTVPDKSLKETRINFTFNNYFSFENRALCKIMWKTLKRSPLFLVICRPIFLRMKTVPDKSLKETRIHFTFNNYFSFENRVLYKIIWKNIIERRRSQLTKWRMRIAFWIPKATNTHTGCVTLIAFPP
jgi:ABC-type spermidine/putrescine transport system permease subunit I